MYGLTTIERKQVKVNTMYGLTNHYQEYYENYLMDDVLLWELTDKDKEILNSAIYIVDNGCSIRECSRNFGISKSQLHRDIHSKIKRISYELYQCVVKQLKVNKRRYFK